MSMEFSDINNTGGGFASGLMAGSCMNKRDEDRGTYIWAVIIFAIIFIIAIIALAVMCKDRGHDRRDYGGTDIAALLTPLIAAKSMECNNGGKHYDYDHDHLEIKSQIMHSDDLSQMRKMDSEIGAMGMLMQKTASDNELKNMEQFGKIENQLGQLTMGVGTLLQERNNAAIIQGVVNQLMCCKPCIA